MAHKKLNDFLHDTLIPGLISLVDTDLFITIHDLEYKVIFTTNKSARSNGLANWQESIGTSYADPPEKITNKLLAKNKDFNLELILYAANRIFTIQQEVVNLKKAIRYIDMLPYDNRYEAFLSCVSPIFFPGSDQVVGLITISEVLPLIDIEDLFKLKENIIKPNTLNSLPSLTNHLSSRQWEIIFLLSIGLNQADIAKVLSIKRGTVSKIMSDTLFDKFNVFTKEELIKESIKQGFNKILPKSLWKHHVILLK